MCSFLDVTVCNSVKTLTITIMIQLIIANYNRNYKKIIEMLN